MVQLRPAQTDRFRRDSWLEINLDRLEHNINALYKEFNLPLIPVLKADAYGHGAIVLAKILDAYDCVEAYAVASVDEAINLREQSSKRILVLGICPDWAIQPALENDIELTVVDIKQAQRISEVAQDINKEAKVQIKLDTGMNRIGLKPESFLDTIKAIESLNNTKITSLFTHFADPDDKGFTQEQYSQFQELTKDLDYPVHAASSHAARTIEGFKSDFIRVGIDLYGLGTESCKPLLSLLARISFIKSIQAGESVSYKRTWTAENDTRIATLPLGYADGLPRALSNQITAHCKGQEIRQVGMVTMDQVMFDLGDNQDIKEGDLVELIGEHQNLNDWADKAGTISYELAVALSLRLPKSYTR